MRTHLFILFNWYQLVLFIASNGPSSCLKLLQDILVVRNAVCHLRQVTLQPHNMQCKMILTLHDLWCFRWVQHDFPIFNPLLFLQRESALPRFRLIGIPTPKRYQKVLAC